MPHAAFGRGPAARGLLGVAVAEGGEEGAGARQPVQVAVGAVGIGDRHGRDGLKDEALAADVPLGGGVGRPQRVVRVAAGAPGERGEHPVVDLLVGVEGAGVDGRELALDVRELLRRGGARRRARVAGQRVELGDAEQGRVVRVVRVLGAEVPLTELGQRGGVLFFVSPAAGWVSGQTLSIDGGHSLF